MLARITLENFFSFGDSTTVSLNQGVNILVGINGSGKSNFLKAIRLLKESVTGEGLEKLFLNEWGGFDSVSNFKSEEINYIKLTFEFDRSALQKAVNNQGYRFSTNPVYELNIIRAGNTGYFLSEKLWSKSKNKNQKPFIFMDMRNTQGIISARENGKISLKNFQKYSNNESEITFKSYEPILRQIADPDRYYPLFTLKRAIEEFAVYDYFDTTLASSIRQPAGFGIEEKLFSNGQNLTSILINLKSSFPLEYAKVQNAIQTINPFFKDITFKPFGNKQLLVLTEKFLRNTISIEHLSDGTLRYLILLSIFFNPKRGDVICIDEPEIGLHPDMINSITKAVLSAIDTGSQFFIATHSPLFLNAFEIDDILIFEKDSENQTQVTTKTEKDFEDWSDNFLVGQLWLRGLIGGKRW